MITSQLIDAVNVLTDEDLPPTTIVSFLNDGMAKLNAELDANFPFLDINNTEQEPIFPEKWQRLLLVVFAAAKVKQMDSSQFEYQDLYNQFTIDLADFKAKYVVPDEYKDTASAGTSISPNFDVAFYGGDW